MDDLESSTITNSVNFPAVNTARTPGTSPITFSNHNTSSMLGHVLSVLADRELNVIDTMNKSRGELRSTSLTLKIHPTAMW